MADQAEEKEEAPSVASESRADQSGVRMYNERLILSLVRRAGQLSKIEVARLTGLSVQSTSAIMNRLQADGLLRREAPLRGRVGQPTVPLSLNPDGAYSLGLNVGRRTCDLVMIDFCGKVRSRRQQTYGYPTPNGVLDFFKSALPQVLNAISPIEQRRVAGLGVAAPFDLWDWHTEIGATEEALAPWRSFSLESALASLSRLPVALFNDATSACAAELFFGEGGRYRDFIYFFVGFFVGGGIVIDGALHPGRTGYSGAICSMPIGAAADGVAPPQLIARASLFQLIHRLDEAGRDSSAVWNSPHTWDQFGEHLDAWIEEAGYALAYASVAARSVIELEAVVIDGAMPESVRARLVASVVDQLNAIDQRGLPTATVAPGTIGADARAIGAAAAPLIKNFARDREVLFKDAVASAA